jgi:uncharacterized protein
MIHNLRLLAVGLTAVALAACGGAAGDATQPSALPNPASVHCEEQGGRLELRTDAAGGVAGYCLFDDGSECDEWQFYRGTCQPGDSLAAAEPAPSGAWSVYHDPAQGLRFEYPAEAAIVPNDDPLGGLSVVGPLVGDDHWPMFSISYPADRPEYRPPEGTDLAQWLREHDMMAEERMPDVQIAGITAVHLRHAPSPQSYGHELYYFAVGDQLYAVVIQHTGDRQDAEVYARFLESIQIER